MWESLRHVKKPSESVGKHKVGFALTVVIDFYWFIVNFRPIFMKFCRQHCLVNSQAKNSRLCLLSKPTCYFRC